MKRIMTLMLVLALLAGVLAGCGTQTHSASIPESTGPDGSAPAQTPAEAPETEASAETSSAAKKASGVELPLTEDPETLSLYIPWPEFLNDYVDSPADSLYYKTMEERTNVVIDFYVVGAETTNETFNLMCAGGDVTDLVVNGINNYAGGADASVEEDILLTLADVIQDWAPNYYSLITADENIYRMAITDTGRMPAIKALNMEVGRQEVGYQIREDWLEDLGLEKPRTLDELHEVLVAFRDEKGADSPLLVTQSATCGLISPAFGVTDNFYVEDGVVKFSSIDPNYKDYLDYLYGLYEEKLIPADFMSIDDAPPSVDAYAPSGRSGIFSANTSAMTIYEEACSDPNARVGATPSVLKNTDEKSERGYYPSWYSSGQSMSVSTNCDDPELATRWIDYNFTEDGAMLANYGVENVTYEYAADGSIQWTDFMANNPDRPLFVGTLVDTCFMGAYHKDYSRDWMTYNDRQAEAADIWAEPYSGYSETYPYDMVTLTADENSQVATRWTDIDTYVSEYRMRVVAGYQTTDDFDEYVKNIEDMGLDQVLEVYQNAYDRFLNR